MNKITATIQDVAQVAGVSTATVSRTLSKPSVVAESTRKAVLEAVAATGYRVNSTASNLRRQRTGTILVLLPNIANPFFAQILAGLSAVLTPASYEMLIADTLFSPDPNERLTHYLLSGQVDGLILLDGTLSPDKDMLGNAPPLVCACEWSDDDLPSVRVDNAKGVHLAISHLAGFGHKKIGHVTGPAGNILTKTRLEAFERAIKHHGLSYKPEWIIEGDFSLDSGVAAARTWCAMDDKPTALFFASDEMALGFMGEVQHLGISVPEDISLVGFDNIEMSKHVSPSLTTIRQPRTEIGESAAKLLLSMLEASDKKGGTKIIDVDFINRRSCAPPRLD